MRGTFRSTGLALFVLATLAALTGCGRASRPVTVDLARALVSAEVLRETPAIDLGTFEARSHLGAGWSVDEVRHDGRTMVWAVGDVSEVAFFLAVPRDLTVDLVCSPVRDPGGGPQGLMVVANGVEVAELELGPGLSSHPIEVPRDATSAGENTILLKWSRTLIPSSVRDSDDPRELAARCDVIGFPGVGSSGAPEARGDDLWIPRGTQVNFYLPAPSSAVLEVDAVVGPSDAGVGVIRRADPAEEEVLARWDADALRRTLAVTNPSRGPILLGFRVRGERDGLLLRRPRVRWTEPVAGEAPQETDAAPDHPPNILVFLVDTLRADRVGPYGWPEDVTPNLDRLADSGVVFERTIAQSSWTKPSVVSVFTGVSPGRHGVNGKRSKLPDGAVTMAELLQDAGYATAGFACNAYITVPAGFAQGFDHFSFRPVRSSEMTSDAIDWLRSRPGDRPFFLYLHTVDPHAPYNPIERYRQRFAPGVSDPSVGTVRHIRSLASREIEQTDDVIQDLLRLYTAEVAENDEALGRLMAVLDEIGVLDDTLIVFLSDHGEEFKEHGLLGHGWDLYREVLQVPLVIRPPGGVEPMRVRTVVQHVDLLPTILSAAGADIPEQCEGTSLWPVMAGRPMPEPRPIYSYLDYEGRRGLAVELDGLKLVEPLSSGFVPARELYLTGVDPEERDSVADLYPVTAGYLASLARAELATFAPDDATEELGSFEPGTREALEALGYIR